MKSKDVMRLAKCGVLGALFAVLGAETAFSGVYVSYWDPDYQCEGFADADRITADTQRLYGDEWYFVEGNVELNHSLNVRRTVGRSSPAKIILMDGARLVVRGQDASPGLDMHLEKIPHALSIYGQKGGTGTLIAYGGENEPGIGRRGEPFGSLTIYGGNVKAYGGANESGVAGSDLDSSLDASGKVVVRGGSLEAFGADGQPGIGAWPNGSGCYDYNFPNV